MKYCGDMSLLKAADVVMVQYDFLSNAGPLIEALLRLPRQPLIIVVKHCASMQFEALLVGEEKAAAYESAWLARVKQRDLWTADERRSRVALWARREREDRELLARYNLTSLDSCRLLRSILNDECRVGGKGLNTRPPFRHNLPRFLRELYFTPAKTKISKNGSYVADPMHQSPSYAVLQGCAAAAAIITAPSHPISTATEESHLTGQAAGKVLTGWCKTTQSWSSRRRIHTMLQTSASSGLEAAIVENKGWVAKLGGKDGKKRWLEASQVGARLKLRFGDLQGVRRLLIEYYAHTSVEKMAAARVEVTLGTRVLHSSSSIDGVCRTGCLPGQGFYFMHVAANLTNADAESVADGAHITLEVVQRPGDLAGSGNTRTFCIVSVIGAL